MQEKHLRETLVARHGSISALLGAMLRMGRNPPPVMVASRKDVLSAFRSGTLLTPVLHELGGEAKALSEQLSDLKRVMTSIRTEGDKLRAETASAERRPHAAGRTAGDRSARRLPSGRPNWPRCARRQPRSHKSVSDLSDLISKLDKEVATRTGLGSYEQEMAAAASHRLTPKRRRRSGQPR